MRPLLFLFLLLAFVLIPSSGEDARPMLGAYPNMRVSGVVLDPRNPANREVGALTYLGGVRLHSRDPAFGGFSAMLVRGEDFLLLSDTGNFVGFRMGDDWRPSRIRFGDLPDGPGTGWAKGSRDSESMTSDPAGGDIWVGFESRNQVWRYDSALGRALGHARPEPMRSWDVNGGAEAMARLANGAFVVLSETSPLPGVAGRAAIYFEGDPADPRTRSFDFAFRPPAGDFNPSDMVALPDGRLLVLVRRISINRWFESKLVLLDPQTILPGASVSGREIAAFTIPLERDNFEAMAVTRQRGRTILWLASDDNLGAFQQSLLMKFRLNLPPP
jgi:hypothetical protein